MGKLLSCVSKRQTVAKYDIFNPESDQAREKLIGDKKRYCVGRCSRLCKSFAVFARQRFSAVANRDSRRGDRRFRWVQS